MAVNGPFPWQRLWAKTSEDGNESRYHPLLCHMLDVAAVAGLVWDHHLTAGLRERLTSALGVPDARTHVLYVAGAHDIGKASPGFQTKKPQLRESLPLSFSGNDLNRPHGFISACVLRDSPGIPSTLLGQISGGHHGVFPRAADMQMGRDSLGGRDWAKARQELLAAFAGVIGSSADCVSGCKTEIDDPFIVPVLAGLIAAADWIGSNQHLFPCVAEYGKVVGIAPAEYWKKSQKQAKEALDKLGWVPGVSFASETNFDSVFPFAANGLQKTVSELALKETAAYLMIVEAPMGHGKTEAAFYAADLAMCRGFARGLYVAMPTQATGNAMFKRVLEDYLKKRGHKGKLNVQLVHGDALLAQMEEVREGEIPNYEPQNIADEEDNGADVEAQSWFTAKKRPLLAPFGVGTIDQSLLSVLQTKHWFVRLFGLAGKVVIFDEVHAYDAYMSTILERLLQWLAELDCTVILLSATLPESRRMALARAYSGRHDAQYRRYPRITLAKPRHYPDGQAPERPVCAEIPLGDGRSVNLQFAKSNIESLAKTLTQRLAHGGCAAVVCNTVDRSIEVYRHLRDALADTECLLFHARTLRMWRREREEEVLRKFGKHHPQDRPLRAVLVATQVIEQSLDLDFDLMVSDIAPIDLLLQRMGRLHRHRLRQRPQGLGTAQFIILCDAQVTGGPPKSFGRSNEFLYERYILLRTWLMLRRRGKVEVPIEIETLIEAVYGEQSPCAEDGWKGALKEAKEEMESDRAESEKAACRLLVCRPKDPGDLIEQFNDKLADDEDPDVDRSVRAATRDGDPSITVVTLPPGTLPAGECGVSKVRSLLDRSVKLSHRSVFQTILKEGESPGEWAMNAHLRHARLLRLDAQGQTRVKNYLLTVDEGLGIAIEKDGDDNV
ncbi:MAG: CRISPR-associated helicase Cas3' [Planctomycetes bacterium]|nr:CRISPR-associated helicase Cas3' [Planctomycetota bacterium]